MFQYKEETKQTDFYGSIQRITFVLLTEGIINMSLLKPFISRKYAFVKTNSHLIGVDDRTQDKL